MDDDTSISLLTARFILEGEYSLRKCWGVVKTWHNYANDQTCQELGWTQGNPNPAAVICFTLVSFQPVKLSRNQCQTRTDNLLARTSNTYKNPKTHIFLIIYLRERALMKSNFQVLYVWFMLFGQNVKCWNWCWMSNICFCYLFVLQPTFTIWGTFKVLQGCINSKEISYSHLYIFQICFLCRQKN